MFIKLRIGQLGFKLASLFVLNLSVFGLLGCAGIPSAVQRQGNVDAIIADQGWQKILLKTDVFDLVSYVPNHVTDVEILTIYIEGDGLAWINRSTPSADPTPSDPVALKMALTHKNGAAAYLGRPCQFVGAETTGCAQRYWTEARFAPEVIEAVDIAVSQLLELFRARRVSLVGYSGGATVSTLIAARRSDVDQLVTIAGNLDHVAWTTHHKVKSLSASLNPVDFADQIKHLPQMHWVGGKDLVIPYKLAQGWPPALIGAKQERLKVIPDFDHSCCWAEWWMRDYSLSPLPKKEPAKR